MRIAIAQLNPRIGDYDATLKDISVAATAAIERGARLLVLPELATTGYPPRDLVERPDFVSLNTRCLQQIAQITNDEFAIVTGFVEPNNQPTGKPLFNSAALCSGGAVQAVYRKRLLPTYDVFDEARYFEPGSESVPFELDGVRIGITICEDMWNDHEMWPDPVYHCDPVNEQAEHDVAFILNLSASPYHLHKPTLRERIGASYASRHSVPFVYVNQVGANDELIFDGRSFVADANGEIAARAAAFETDLLVVDTDNLNALSRDEQPDMPATDSEEVYQALVLGVRDYFAKSGFRSAVLGLSGGIDSALTAAIACDALGAENVHGVSMPSRYSSDHSVSDAEQLAQNLGMPYREIPIEPVFNAFTDVLAEPFEGLEENVAEENLQARARGVILMALSNKFGHLVLTTGNKSELAVGYCTLYGDMCGALAVISDVPKTIVYDISRWLNDATGREIIPANTIEKPPSAELRPGQVDQDSLPPYDVLDEIIRLYVKERRSVEEIVARHFDAEVVGRIVRLIDRNEFKRRQAAPGLKVTPRAFGSGRRFPIVAAYDHLHRG